MLAWWGRTVASLLLLAASVVPAQAFAADETFIYSSENRIRGVNLTLGSDDLLTTTPLTGAVNGLAINTRAGLVYYGDETRVYRWDPALGSGAGAHTLMNDFAVGPLTSPIRNINSTSGSFIGGRYYVGSETDAGYIEDIHELTMSIDGTQVVSIRALDLQGACDCADFQLGGFGDTAATLEGGEIVLYGASTDISGSGAGTSAGRWRFVPGTNTFTLLSSSAGGQMSGSPEGRVFTNVGNSVREFDTTTGAVGSTSLFTLSEPPYDFTEGFRFDFGDAASSYGGAFHRQGSQGDALVYIGATPPDNDAGTYNGASGSTDGRGDDLAGVDDEDALDVPPALDTNDTAYAVTLQCSAGSRVAGWVDFDIDGTFDAAERNANHPVTCANGSATLSWTDLSGIRPGESMIRLRASTNAAAVSDPLGIASDGEVEDHPVSIDGVSPPAAGSCAAGETSHVYRSTQVPRSIGPNRNTTTVSRLTVPDALIPTDVNVIDVRGTHTYINDLVFSLRHDGTTRTLYGPACNGRDDFDFGFDDEASAPIPCPPTAGLAHAPTQSLDVYAGDDASGQWQLRIFDRFNGDGGELESWGLEICTAAPVIEEAPDIRLGKSASVDGREVAFVLLAENVGDVALDTLSLVDDLDVVFGSGNHSIVAAPLLLEAPSGIALATGWTGASGASELLAPGGALAPGERLRIAFTVRVDTIAGSPPGSYANGARVAGTSPLGEAVDDLSGDGLDLSDDGDAPTPFEVDASARLSGHVFRDTSSVAAGAHDGVRRDEPGGAGDEPGVSGVDVSVVDAGGTVLATTRTNALGAWSVRVPAAAAGAPLRVIVRPGSDRRLVSEAAAFTVGPVDDGETAVTPGIGETVTGIDTGLVFRPTLEIDHESVAEPGSAVRYPHRFRVSSHGTLGITFATRDAPPAPSWPNRLVRDLGCDGRIDPGDLLVTATDPDLAVAFDELVCLVVDVFVPARAAGGATQEARLDLVLTLADASATGHGVAFALDDTDVTRVIARGTGRLVLDKSVRNVTLGEAPGVTNTARPGHVLEYRIGYRNDGSAPIGDLVIDDSAPAFTTVLGGTVACDDTPTAMTCTPGVAGASLDWRFAGALPAGGSGRVSYRVTID